jgi:hypothetical protein
MAAVEGLGTQGASGVLEVTGDPSGAIYLEGGRITFAQATWVPGLAARLRGIQPVPVQLAELLASQGGEDDAAVAAHIARGGYLTTAGLHRLIQSIVIDVLMVLTIPLAVDAPGAAVRFASTRAYWPEKFPRLDVAPLRLEAIRWAQRMAQCGLAPTTSVALRRLRMPAAVLTSQQWAVARHLTAPASAQELALRSGGALADTMECLGSLMQAGLCAPVRVGGRRLPPPPAASLAGPAAEPTARYAPTLPNQVQRLPVTSGSYQPPSVAILRQVLDGLRKLK